MFTNAGILSFFFIATVFAVNGTCPGPPSKREGTGYRMLILHSMIFSIHIKVGILIPTNILLLVFIIRIQVLGEKWALLR